MVNRIQVWEMVLRPVLRYSCSVTERYARRVTSPAKFVNSQLPNLYSRTLELISLFKLIYSTHDHIDWFVLNHRSYLLVNLLNSSLNPCWDVLRISWYGGLIVAVLLDWSLSCFVLLQWSAYKNQYSWQRRWGTNPVYNLHYWALPLLIVWRTMYNDTNCMHIF